MIRLRAALLFGLAHFAAHWALYFLFFTCFASISVPPIACRVVGACLDAAVFPFGFVHSGSLPLRRLSTEDFVLNLLLNSLTWAVVFGLLLLARARMKAVRPVDLES